MTVKQFAQWLIDNHSDKFSHKDNLGVFFDDFGLNEPFNYDSIVYQVATKQWLCTDSWVGDNFIFLKQGDEFMFVCITQQSGRKMGVETFYNEDSVVLFEAYLIELCAPDLSSIQYIEEDEEYSIEYTIEYAGQVLHGSGQAYYNGKPVEVTLQNSCTRVDQTMPADCKLSQNDYTFYGVKILHENSTTEWIDVRDLVFKTFEV